MRRAGIGTYLYGRRVYETMRYWETVSLEGQPALIQDYTGIWRSADKIVYYTTLTAVSSARTRIETRFDPAEVRELKQHGDVSVGGTAVFPDGVRARLDLADEHRFASGSVYLRYRARD